MENFEVIIIGGSYAGLSAGMALGRSLRKVLIIDSGLPCNRYAPHSHNFITHDGEAPADIAKMAKEQVMKYPTITWLEGKATGAVRVETGFAITTEAEETFTAKKLLFATGVVDVLPDTPGFAECWGKSIIHCPYCHGYEVKGLETGILLNGETAAHFGHLIRNWTNKLTIFTNGPATIEPKDIEALKNHGVTILETPIMHFVHQNGNISGILLETNMSIPLQALYTHPLRVQHTDLPEKLGCKMTEHDLIEVDSYQLTTVPGIYAAGDNSTIFRAVSVAVANGTMAGTMINKDLVMDRL